MPRSPRFPEPQRGRTLLQPASTAIHPRPRTPRPSDTVAHASVRASLPLMEPLAEEEILIDEPLFFDPGSGSEIPCARARPESENMMQSNSAADPPHSLEERGRVTSTLDIRHFFERKQDATVCTYCRRAHNAEPVNWDKGYMNKYDHNFSYSPNTGTSVLRRHIDRHHLLEYVTLAEAHGWQLRSERTRNLMACGYALGEIRDTLAAGMSLPDIRPHQCGTSSASLPSLSIKAFYKHLTALIIATDKSLNLVECKEFRNLLLVLREDLEVSELPDRAKIREEIVKAWQQYLTILRGDFALALGRISVTADVWSSRGLHPFLALTAHWIVEESDTKMLKMRSALLGFRRIRVNYTGTSLARTILYILDRAGMTAKVGHFTMDHTSINKSCIQELELLFQAREIEFNAHDRLIMCFLDVVNTCTTHVKAYVEAIQSGPISKGRNIVHIIRASSLRRGQFADTIKIENWFNDAAGKTDRVPDLELLRDVETRWDSTYAMLNRLRALRPAVDYFLDSRGLEEYAHSRSQWEVLEDFERVLQVPYEVQQHMLSENMPRLGRAVPCFEFLMSAWEGLGTTNCRVKPWIDVGIQSAGRHYKRTDNTHAYIIAMFIDPAIRLQWIRSYWDAESLVSAEKTILQMMREYQGKIAESASKLQQAKAPVDTINSLAACFGIKDKDARESTQTTMTTIEEYNSYVNGSLWEGGRDPLLFWKAKRQIYPTLFAIAMDYLPIQALSIPSERIFSPSANTDIEDWTGPSFMEARQMLKYDFRQSRLSFTAGAGLDARDLMEDEPEDPALDSRSVDWDREEFVEDMIIRVTREEGQCQESVIDYIDLP